MEFGGESLTWFNPPPSAVVDEHGMAVHTAAGTDFWQRTHYGFEADNGHALLTTVHGDFRIESALSFEPVHQYDQAGIMVRLSARCWLKVSTEFELHQPSRLGSVVTNRGWSDWATQDVSPSLRSAQYRVSRHGGDYTVEYAAVGGAWSQLRVAHLHEDDGTRPISVGLYACSPKGAGFRAVFQSLRVDRA